MTASDNLLKSIVACSSPPESSASRDMQKVCTVPASLIEAARCYLRGPTPEGKRFLKNLMRRVYIGPNHFTSLRWTVCARRVVKDQYFVVLGACGLDHAVFSYWIPRIGPKMCPTDKFTSGATSGMALFKEICARDS